MNKKRKRILSLALSFIFLGHIQYSESHKPQYKIIKSTESLAFARYSKGLVYIGNQKFLEKVNPGDNDILILDQRAGKDPNMKVFASYRISDVNVKNEILKILLEYEKMYPSKWDRTIESMRLEWYIHNIMHLLNYKLDRTTDVDFNNKDEETYVVKKLTI